MYCSGSSYLLTIDNPGTGTNDSPLQYPSLTFDWYKETSPTMSVFVSSGSSLNVNEPGTYAVTITTTKGCSKTRSIEVLPSSIPTIDSVDFTDGVEMTSVVVNVSGSGSYEYAIDNPLNGYQDSNVFLMVSAGIHRLYVRDKNGCGSTEKNISVIGFPKFFTPNGDGFNDRWHLTGINSATKLKSDVYIFDRFGKLLIQLNPIGINSLPIKKN